MSESDLNITDMEYETSILLEAYTFLKNMVPLNKKGAYALGNTVSVYMDIQGIEEREYSLYITCYAFGSRIVHWDRMAVIITTVTEKSIIPIQCGFFNSNGHLVFSSLPADSYMITPFNRLKDEIRIAPSLPQELVSDTRTSVDFSIAAQGATGENVPVEFTSLDGCIQGALMTTNGVTEIIIYTRDKEYKGDYVHFAFINPESMGIVNNGQIQLIEHEDDPAYLKGVWKDTILTEEPVSFIFSDPMKD